MTANDYSDRGEPSSSWIINHLPAILWQRRLYIVVPFVALLIAGVAAAFLLPTIYRSSATLMVESQDLPTTVVDSPVSGAIDQRIAGIREQVLSRGNLISIIEHFRVRRNPTSGPSGYRRPKCVR